EQFARRLLAAALHLRQVAEADPGGIRHLTQGAGLLGARTTQHVADRLAQQCRHRALLPHWAWLIGQRCAAPGWFPDVPDRCALLFAQALIAVLRRAHAAGRWPHAPPRAGYPSVSRK